jgi:hypothetical protein
MKKYMPEFIAVPLTIVLLGIVFLILVVADAGLVTFLVVGAIALVAIVVVAVVLMRRPRASAVSRGSAVFEGAAPPVGDDVHRVLLVIDDVCTKTELESLKREQKSGPNVFVVAPAVSSRLDRWTGDERAYADAKEDLDATLRALEELGVEATGHVGAHDPLQAADDGLREFAADEIVFVLHGGHDGEWLEERVVEIGRQRYPVPVRELTSTSS